MVTRKGLEANLPTHEALAVVADRIFELGRHRGFVGVRTVHPDRALVVWWRGDPPRRVVKYAQRAPLDVAVTIVPGAKYSRAEAEVARKRLLKDPIATRLEIVSVWVRGDGSGLCIAVNATDYEAQQMRPLIAKAAGMPDIWIVKAD